MFFPEQKHKLGGGWPSTIHDLPLLLLMENLEGNVLDETSYKKTIEEKH